MPVMKVRTRKGTGYRWGRSGTIYYGRGAKSKAQRQARAIYASGYRKRKG